MSIYRYEILDLERPPAVGLDVVILDCTAVVGTAGSFDQHRDGLECAIACNSVCAAVVIALLYLWFCFDAANINIIIITTK